MAPRQDLSLPSRRPGFAPPGTNPPFILSYDASTVPVIQLALSSDQLSESQIFDIGNNIIRTSLATIPGAALPFPYGGYQRQVQVDLTSAGRALLVQCNCLNETLIERSGMTLAELDALNRQIQALRDALSGNQ